MLAVAIAMIPVLPAASPTKAAAATANGPVVPARSNAAIQAVADVQPSTGAPVQ